MHPGPLGAVPLGVDRVSFLQPLLKEHEAAIDAKLAQAQTIAGEKIKKAQDAIKTD